MPCPVARPHIGHVREYLPNYPPLLDENLWKCGEKYVKYPVTRKHPVRNPVNFAQPKFWENVKI